MNDHQILFPEPERVRLGRRTIKIRAVQLRHFELFGQTASATLQYLQSASAQELAAFAMQYHRKLRHAVVACTSLTRVEACFLSAAQALQLFAHVLRVNVNFFAEAQNELVRQLDGLLSPID